jgi:glycosyltransferase involved in cell wall biosynthesis
VRLRREKGIACTIMSKTTLSVIIPNYNHGHYIGEALEVVVGQSFRPLEVIVIDDCSTDQSVEVIEKFVSRDSTVRLSRNERNLGPVPTVNIGLEKVKGDFVYTMAADDRISPGFFEKSIQLLDQYPQAGLCSADMAFIDERGRWTGNYRATARTEAAFLSPDEVLTELYNNPNYIIGGATIFRRSALEEAGGFPPQLLSLCDWFTERAIALKYGACYVPEALFLWRQTANNYSSATFKNVPRMLGVVSAAVKLMRSPPYRESFPLAFIEFWHNWFLEQIKSHLIGRLEEQQRAFLGELQTCVDGQHLSDRIYFGLIYRLARAQMLLSKTYLERHYFRRHLREVQRECESVSNSTE